MRSDGLTTRSQFGRWLVARGFIPTVEAASLKLNPGEIKDCGFMARNGLTVVGPELPGGLV